MHFFVQALTKQMTGCVVSTKGGTCCRNAPSSVWDSLPQKVRLPVCRALIDYGMMQSCDSKRGKCSMCTVHMRYALVRLLESPFAMATKTLVEMAMCRYAGYDSSACEEFFTAQDGIERWIG